MKAPRKAGMNKKLLCLLLASSSVFAVDTPRFCQADMVCAPCKQDKQDKDGKDDQSCRSVNGKRIDHGASLGARPTPGRNAERELSKETFVLSDANLDMPLSSPPAKQRTEAVAAPVVQPAPVTVTRVVERTSMQPGERTELAPSTFTSGGSELGPSLKTRLDELVTHLKGHGKLRLEVIGHTDNQRLAPATKAKYHDNQGLGLARANIVARYLRSELGLPAERVSTASRGQDQPLASNANRLGMAQNRRVEVRAWFEDVLVHQETVEEVLPSPVVVAPIVIEPAPLPPVVPAPLQSCAEVLANRTRAADAPFRISIDGVPQNEGGKIDIGVIDPDIQRCTDVELEGGDLQLRYDPLEQTPVLNAHAWPNAVVRGALVEIAAYSNYAAYIERAEIRIFAPEASTQGVPLAVLPVTLGGIASWTPTDSNLDAAQFLLRVYDRDGRFDETSPKRIDVVDKQRPTGDVDIRTRELLAGYGENSRALHNIPVHGGAVTANGNGIKVGESVRFLGTQVPVDAKGEFVARQILPAGPRVVDVAVLDAQGAVSRSYARNLSIAADDWFFLGLADLTLGRNSTSGPAALVTADASDHFDNQVYLDGRLAFYLKGKVKGEWLLTASADTREQPLRSLFSNFAEKDPKYLLRRLDPDKYYPVYGDDSTTIDDAPTQGKFFVRLEKGLGPDNMQVMWGNFQTTLTGTDFANFNRALYGARGRLVSDTATQYGEKRGKVEVFAAQPGTLQARNEFRGTGGSLYYLRNLDITPGSERVWIEIRDKDSGIVLSTQPLVAVQDYEVNAIQGRISLREALASTAGAGTLVQAGSFGGHPVHMVVSYEYSPAVANIEEMVVGGRGSVWVNDHLQIGASAFRQDNTGQMQRLHGIDATLRYKPGTYVKIEGARTDGAGTGAQASLDGGFSFSPIASGGAKADAQRIEAGVDLAEISSAKGKATMYWQDREAGFSGPGQTTAEAIRQSGASVVWQASEFTELLVKLDEKDATSQTTRAAEVNVKHRLNDNWSAGVGLRADDVATNIANASPTLSQSGRRSDLVLRADYLPDEGEKAGWKAYGFVQGTLESTGTRNDNDRVGIGGERRINDRFKLGGELSQGDGGLGARVSGDWQVDDRSSLYVNYNLTPDRTDDGFRGRAGQLTAGGKTRFTDAVSVFAEERYQHGDGPSGLTHAFGLDYSPNDRWTYGGKLEAGELSDVVTGDLRRRAIGLSLGYRKDATRYAGALEYRHEQGTFERETWLLKNTLGYQVNPDWRFLGRLNISRSQSNQGDFYDGEFTELVAGYAWRPVNNDRWNTLFKYTWFYNLPSPGQLANGALADYAQKSHVLSVDTVYDVRPWVSVGGKLGVRRGELKDAKVNGDWYSSTAWLGILRADWHWVHEWDVLTELRYLDAKDAGDSQAGALLAVYKHLGKHFKLGAGYNFTDFSDELTNVSYRSHGWFINLIGKI
jgi:outer membrane protein OmpA-like peptidoglycan-associated protein